MAKKRKVFSSEVFFSQYVNLLTSCIKCFCNLSWQIISFLINLNIMFQLKGELNNLNWKVQKGNIQIKPIGKCQLY